MESDHSDDENKEGKDSDQRLDAQQLEKLIVLAKSEDHSIRYDAVIQLRKQTTLSVSPPIQKIIDFGIVDNLITYLKSHDVQLQIESAWCLTNIASGTHEQTSYLMTHGIQPPVVSLLKCTDLRLFDQIVWLLGNLIGDSELYRDEFLSLNTLPLLLDRFPILTSNSKLLDTLSWTLSNYMRGSARPEYTLIAPLLDKTPELLFINDPSCISYLLWGLSYLTQDNEFYCTKLIEHKLLPHLLPLFHRSEETILDPLNRLIGHFVFISNNLTETLLNLDLLYYILPLLNHESSKILKYTVWLLSNIAAGTLDQKYSLVKSGCVEKILCIYDYSLSKEIKIEILYLIANMVDTDNREIIRYIVQTDIINKILIPNLSKSDENIVQLVLSSMKSIISRGVFLDSGQNSSYYTVIINHKSMKYLQRLKDNKEFSIDTLNDVTSLCSELEELLTS